MRRAEGTPMFLRDAATRHVLGANEAGRQLLARVDAAVAGGVVEVAGPDGGEAVDIDIDGTWIVDGAAELIVAWPTAMPTHDAATGLPTLSPILERLVAALDRSAAGQGTTALLFVDVDDLGALPEIAAREVVDALWRRLGAAVRRADVIGRSDTGGFVVLCEHLRNEIEAAGLAAAIVDDLVRPVPVGASAVAPQVVVGVALAGDPGMTVDALRTDPLAATAAARIEGRVRHERFIAAIASRARQHADLAEALRRAIEQEEFVVHYQPVVDLRDGVAREVEALVRWAVPGGSLVPPDRFIPTAERTGLIAALGEWVLRVACRFAAERPGIGVAVNVSACQVAPDLVGTVQRALDDVGLAADRLRLELTESTFLDDAELATAVLHELTDLGVGLSLDDFGTGYSSLLYLRKLPFDRLKIDRSFIRVLGETPSDRDLVAAVLGLARAVGVRTTAEGVETDEQARILVELGCEEAQGYLFGRPMAPEACDAWFQQALT